MIKKKIITLSSILFFVVLTSSLYLVFDDKMKVEVENTKTEYSINDSNKWVLAATEYVNLYDGTKKMRAKSRERTEIENGEFFEITRKSIWKDNITTIQTYIFDIKESEIERIPLKNTFECFNCEGKIVHYEVRDIKYDGKTKVINSPFSFGNNMEIEFMKGYYYAKVFNQKETNKIIIKYRPESNYEVYNVRLYDPIKTTFNNSLSSENITFGGNENITRYLSIPTSATDIVNATMFIKSYTNNSSYTTFPYIDVNNTKIFELPLWCYQEDYVTPNQTGIDGDCGQRYGSSGAWGVPAVNWWQFRLNLRDGDWNSFVDWYNVSVSHIAFQTVYQDYFFPSYIEYGRMQNYVKYQYKIDNSPLFIGNFTVIQQCIDYFGTYIRINITQTYTGSGPRVLSTTCMTSINRLLDSREGRRYFYEEAMWWGTNGTFLSNRSLSFTSKLNDAFNHGNCDCAGCSIDGDNCLIPFIFHSDTEGKLEYSNLEVNYTFNFTPVDFNATITPNTQLIFIPDNYTHKGINAYGQNSTLGVFTFNNNHTTLLDIFARVNVTNENVTMKMGSTNNYSNSISMHEGYS
jgi:hypothetical protein